MAVENLSSCNGNEQQAGKLAVSQRESFHSIWSGFYKKALKERQNQLRLVYTHLFPSQPSKLVSPLSAGPRSSNGVPAEPPSPEPIDDAFPLNGLDEQIADNMVENCVGTLGLPVGIGLNFTINSIPTVVPMCIEEPSVVAAASGAAKTISTFGGGFTATTTDKNIIYAQIQVMDIEDDRIAVALEQVKARRDEIIALGNQFCQNMVGRGGGVMDVTVRQVIRRSDTKRPKEVRLERSYGSWIVVHLHIDVCDAMGANCASAVAEGTAPLIASLTGGRIGLRIVSNLSVERMAKASFRVPIDKLGYKGIPGQDLAFRVVEANEWARSDPYRATTHNKGIMNGIDAVALATGQDWRAIEAAGHAWNGVRADHYRPFTDYWVEEDDDGRRYLRGELELPMPVATKGGVLKTNPVYSYTLGLLNKPDSKSLAKVMVAVGLAQNFAALRALCTEGIQRGHMSLHARNIAIAAGAPPHAIAECVTFMVETGRFTRSAVKEYLTAHEVHHKIRLNGSFEDIHSACSSSDLNGMTNGHANGNGQEDEAPPSLFYFEESDLTASRTAGVEDRVTLNVAFQTLGAKPVHIELVPNVPPTKVVRQLFGEKSHAWLSELYGLLESLKLITIKPERANVILAKKLKLLSVLLNILIRRLATAHPLETARFIKRISSTRSASSELDLSGNNADSPTTETPPSHKLGSGIFRHRVILDVDLKHISSTGTDHLRIGFPLILAIWQVFEFRVQQWVGEPLLARALIDEQWRVVLALVDAPLRHIAPHASSPESFKAVMATHAKRFQSTIFALCDAISFPEAIVTSSLVRVLRCIGKRLECEHAVAHDLSSSRLLRDLKDMTEKGWSDDGGLGSGVVNSFLLWLKIVKGWNEDMVRQRAFQAAGGAHVHQLFREEMAAFLGDVSRKQDLVELLDSVDEWHVLDRSRLKDAMMLFRIHYEIDVI
ncbi:hydroxymethylglutaryl-CoA reductase (NADPH) [Spizellomyces sp. 'palustris']|nr:hydroxymethylglutaryl-CoA reductase (NADPH) [Spizellomyces sp. 'palustris']